MTKTLLSAALAVSVLINLALLRRDPPAASAPVPRSPSPQAPAATAAPPRSSSPAPAGRNADAETDVLFLREEVRKLREQLTLAQARHSLQKNLFGPDADDPAEQPEAREFRRLLELVTSFIEMRMTEVRDEQGRTVIVGKRVLTPDRRQEAFRALEEFLALEGDARSSFRDQAQSAVAAYYRIADTYEREMAAAKKAGDNDDFFEDAGVRNQKITDRFTRRHEEWVRHHVQPLRDLL